MKKELIISHDNDTDISQIALLEDGRLLEIHKAGQHKQFVVGDLFLGKIKKLAPTLNAAFVNIGYEKDAFLHYLDLGPQIHSYQKFVTDTTANRQQTSALKNFEKQSEIKKDGTIDKVLASGQSVLLQITKEPISTKGPRISTQISLTGRYLVLIPFDNKVSVSKKIKSLQEKNRLKTLVESIRPEGFGVIIRTVAENKKTAELYADMNHLISKWETCFKNIKKNKVPSKVLREEDKASAILRDNFNSEFVSIVCDDEQMVADMKKYLHIIAPEREDIVQYYDKPLPLFEYYNIDKQLKHLFGTHVNIPSSKGAYLVIEHTEALHVVDVNSGNNITGNTANKLLAFTVNKMAATEIARQLRLRDMGGIIVVDFIDMPEANQRKDLFEHLKSLMKEDKARHKILPPSKFGLIQITRQRVRPATEMNTLEDNPNKDGQIEPPIVTIRRLGERIESSLQKDKGKLYLHVHPFIAAYLTKGIMSPQHKWFLRYKRWVSVIPRNSFKYLEYELVDGKGAKLFEGSN